MNPEPETSRPRPWRLILDSIVFVILALAPATCMFHGASLYSAEWKAATGEYFYVPLNRLTGERRYVEVGSISFFLGIAGIAALAYLAFGRKGMQRIVAVVVLVGAFFAEFYLIGMGNTPEHALSHANGKVFDAMRSVKDALIKAADPAKHFPRGEEELRPLVRSLMDTHSMFARGGTFLPYRVVLVPMATGPYFPDSQDLAPATIYCAVSPDHRKFWLTGTMLRTFVDDRVRLEPDTKFEEAAWSGVVPVS